MSEKERRYKKREIRVVSFNTTDPVELELLKFVDQEGVNFSGLMKNLLFMFWCMQNAQQMNLNIGDGGMVSGSLNKSPAKKETKAEKIQEIKSSGMPFDL